MKLKFNELESTKYNTKSSPTDSKSILNRNMFKFNYIIGKGGFGKVWKVRYKKTNEIFALKEMSKKKIIDKKSEKSINNERIFLSKLRHPFLVNMHFAFQDNDNLYLVIDILNGGDLRFHCSRYRTFSEEQTRFFIACMVHALSYIHENNVIHRDIKPENLVLDDKGYLHITDFGIAKENSEDNSNETSGTPGYMAPEVINGKSHSFSVDYFAIGVIGYEFMSGKRPYNGKNRKEIKEQMLSYQAKIKNKEIAKGWSMESRDFINKLLKRKAKLRLGSKKGIKELKEHFWLKYYPWKELENKILPGPFIPEKRDNFDKKYCEGIDKITENTKLRYEEIAKAESYKTAFANFYFNKEENKDLEKKMQNTTIINNNKSNLIKDYKGNFTNINSPISTKSIVKVMKNSDIINKNKEYKNPDNKCVNFRNLYKDINNNIKCKKINQRIFILKNKKRKEKMQKSASHQFYEDKSLYSLLNSNSGIISVKNKNKKNEKNKYNNEEKNFSKNVNNIFKNKNNSFTNIGFVKNDIIYKNKNFISKKIIKYHLNDKKTSFERKTLKEDINSEQKSISYLLHNNSSYFNLNIHPIHKSGLSILNNVRNKIFYHQIYKNKNNNNNENINESIKLSKRNNSFFLKKTNNNFDLSSIRLYNLNNNSIINSNKKFHNISNIQEVKGSKTSRKNNDKTIFNYFIRKMYNKNKKNIKKINRTKSVEVIYTTRRNKLMSTNIKNNNYINNIDYNNKKIDNNKK